MGRSVRYGVEGGGTGVIIKISTGGCWEHVGEMKV